jgi:hypothetical protein
MPVSSGWEQLGNVLGGGVDHTGAYEGGQLYASKTIDALEQAKGRQLSNIAADAKQKARDSTEQALIASGTEPTQAHLLATIMTGETGSDYSAGMTGLAKGQETNFRNVLGDPTASPTAQFAAGQAVKGEVLNPYANLGDSFVDLRAPVAPGAPASLQQTPLGVAKVGAENALAHQRMQPPASAAEGGLKPNDKYQLNPNYDPTKPADSVTNPQLIPVIGGPADPNTGTPMGARERQAAASVMHSALETAQRLDTIMRMPTGANRGIFNSHPGTTLLGAMSGNLQWGLSPEEVNDYNTVVTGLARNFAVLESYGRYAPSGAAMQQFETLKLAPNGTETVYTKMLKMADLRNTVENTMHTFLAMNPNVPDSATNMAQRILSSVQESIPFTMNDVVALRAAQDKNPRLPLGEMSRQRQQAPPKAPGATAQPGAPAPAPAAAPTGAPVQTHSEADYNVLPSGTLYLMPGETTPRRKL